MLGSRRIYRLVRIVLGILTILSMLGIRTKIFADTLSIFDKLNKIDVSMYNNFNQKTKDIIQQYSNIYDLVFYFDRSEVIWFYNIDTIKSETDNYFLISTKTGGYIYSIINDNLSFNNSISEWSIYYNQSYLYKFVYDNVNYEYPPKTYYNVVLNVVGNGQASGSGSYQEGSNVEISAISNENNIFVGWFNDAELLDLYSSESSTTISNINSDITLYAQFIEKGSSDPEDPNPEQPIKDTNSYKYLSAILIVVCMIYWNDVLKEYL